MEIQARFVKIGFRCRPVCRILNRIQYVVSNINAAHIVVVSPSDGFRTDLSNHSYAEEPFDILQPKDRAL